MTRASYVVAAAFCALIIAARPSAQVSGPRFGDPLPGLLPAEFERFRVGLDDFVEVETAEEGLGPAFNAASCAVCHNVPAIGGTSLVSEVRAAYRDESGQIHKLTAPDGTELDTLYHLFSNPPHNCQPVMPPEANIIARRVPIAVFGAGLVEAIGDETLIALEDPDDRNGDGISGRAARVVDVGTGHVRIGRFGWKAQHATLRTFSGDAYRNEMGITNELFPHEAATGVSAAFMKQCDPRPDPEEMFNAIGCATCHVPVLQTATNAHPLFSRRPVPLFSDLLLHDVGTGDDIPQASALPNEIRTPALWGLRARRPLLHDGSASTPEDAVGRHRGEAEGVRRRFEQLNAAQKKALVAFLNSL
jgi:CxxC motif-containing protein (DUF1111 family)